jgi:uncharacterized protein YqgC (DUF456 family)
MDMVGTIMGSIGTGIAMLTIVILCAVAVVLSCVSISGTWVVLGAAVLGMIIRGDTGFPGWLTLVAFALISVAVEVGEAVAGSWGVAKRGGSRLAGVATLIGGFVGLFVGALIPIPIVGSLIGMLVLSFGAAFAVEHWRLKHVEHAMHIAWGAVWARVLVIFLKVAVTLGMSVFLIGGIALAR